MKRTLFIIVVLFTLFRIPSLFEPYWHGDEGITLTVGNAIRQGEILYRDITDNKTPILYFVSAWSENLFNFKLITSIVSLAALLAFIRLKDKMGASMEYISLTVFVLLIGTPLIEANIVNAEIYMVLPTVLSIIAYMNKQYILAGMYGSVSFLLKPPGLVEVAALAIHALYTNKHYVRIIRDLAVGFTIPIAVMSVYFLLVHGFYSFITEAFINNVLYTGSWRLLMDPKLWILTKLVALSAFLLYLFVSRKSYKSTELLLFLWLVFALFGATLSNRPYPHYLIQIVAPLCILIGTIIQKNYTKVPTYILLSLVVFFAIVQFRINPGMISYAFGYYHGFTNPLFFDPEVVTTDQIVTYLEKNTAEHERVFVWSDNSLIYAKSKRLPATRYVSAYHIMGNENREREVVETLEKNPPKIIIVTKPVKHNLPPFQQILTMRYNLVETHEKFDIYNIK